MSGAYRLGAVAILGLVLATAAGAQPSVERGKLKFEHSCAPCHGTGGGNDGHAELPGTEALRLKYRGTIPAALEQRTDLTAETIRAFVA